MVILTTILLYVLSLLILKPIITLIRNYIAARKTGLRLIISPLTPYTPLWTILTPLLRPYLQTFTFFRAIDWTYCWADGNTLHSRLGANFILVSPGLNVLCTSDPKSIEHVLKKWKEFVKPDNVNEILGTFGQNVDTSNGEDWTRHRRIVGPCFGERGMEGVWDTAQGEVERMIGKWTRSGRGVEIEEMHVQREQEKEEEGMVTSLVQDTSTLALNVISSVAFENHDVNRPTDGHTLSLREALVTVMSTAISPSMESVVPWIRSLGLTSIFPQNIRKLLLAMSEFRQYMDETIQRERDRRLKESKDDGTRSNLISTLIKANDMEESGKERGLGKGMLSDVELRGNVFIFTVGGLESTAITVSYALALLAVHEDVQGWVAQEIDEVLDTVGDNKGYATAFPKMKRVMAIMYETLRIYGPSPPLPRSHFNSPSTPTYTIPSTSNTSITLPSTTQIMLNSWACQVSPSYFSSPSTWNPKRWLDTTGTLLHPTSESGFYAWGSGPRICPGMKFSQVEFVGVLVGILGRVRVGLVDNGKGESEGERKRLLGVLGDSCADPLLLHIRKPEEVRIRVEKRERL